MQKLKQVEISNFHEKVCSSFPWSKDVFIFIIFTISLTDEILMIKESHLHLLLIFRKRSVFPGPKMCSSTDRRAVCGQDCRRGQVHLQPWPQPRRPQKGGHHMSHVETSAHSGALGDLQLRGRNEIIHIKYYLLLVSFSTTKNDLICPDQKITRFNKNGSTYIFSTFL